MPGSYREQAENLNAGAAAFPRRLARAARSRLPARWLTRQARNRRSQIRFNARRKLELRPGRRAASRQAVVQLWEALTPRKLTAGTLVRYGRSKDGGYILRGDFPKSGTLISIGVGGHNEIDVEFAELGWRVTEWDHTVGGPPQDHANISFHRVGIGTGPGCVPLDQIMERSGRYGDGLILMIDVEGAEYSSGSGLTAKNLEEFNQVLIELHDVQRIVQSESARLAFSTLIRELTTHHGVAHVHVNNFRPVFWVGGLPLPGVLEVTLVRRSELTESQFITDLPTELDCSNDPLQVDQRISLPGR